MAFEDTMPRCPDCGSLKWHEASTCAGCRNASLAMAPARGLAPETRQVQARVPSALIEELDALAARRSSAIAPVTRSDVVRDLLVEGLRAAAREVSNG